jgi:hypothetical protein
VTRLGRSAFLLPVLVLALTACGGVPASVSAAAGGGTATVLYEVTGPDSTNNITYSANGSAGIAQENGAAAPWTKEVQFEAGAFRVASLTAQNAGGGDITCRITVDGEVKAETTSSGEYAVVSCNTEAF